MDAISYSRALKAATQQSFKSLSETALTVMTSTISSKMCLEVPQYNICNRQGIFVAGGSAMHILVPWKPLVLVWGLLSGMIFVGFVASSVLQGKDPFAPGATITQPTAAKTGTAQSGQQLKRSNKAVRTPNQ